MSSSPLAPLTFSFKGCVLPCVFSIATCTTLNGLIWKVSLFCLLIVTTCAVSFLGPVLIWLVDLRDFLYTYLIPWSIVRNKRSLSFEGNICIRFWLSVRRSDDSTSSSVSLNAPLSTIYCCKLKLWFRQPANLEMFTGVKSSSSLRIDPSTFFNSKIVLVVIS